MIDSAINIRLDEPGELGCSDPCEATSVQAFAKPHGEGIRLHVPHDGTCERGFDGDYDELRVLFVLLTRASHAPQSMMSHASAAGSGSDQSRPTSPTRLEF